MDAPQWSQQVVGTLARPMEELENTTQTNNNNQNNNNNNYSTRISTTPQSQETPSLERRTTRPLKDEIINCPRCNSTNTKFCYYNNYSLTQPRFFCKTCRRYWTQGGSLRSVPMGGGSRKNKRSSTSSYSSPSTPPPPRSTPLPLPLPLPLPSSQNPNNIKFLQVGQDLNLAFPMQGLFHHHHHNMDQQLPKIEGNDTKNQNYGLLSFNMNNTTTAATTTTGAATNTGQISALELLRSGIASRGNLNPFVPLPMPDSNTLYQSGSYPNMQEFKPSNMNFFSSPNHENNNNNNNNNDNDSNNNNNGARLLFPFADMNKLATNNNHDEIDHDNNDDQSKGNSESDHNHSGYWSGMLGGGPW